jgi:hypothetical protein
VLNPGATCSSGSITTCTDNPAGSCH